MNIGNRLAQHSFAMTPNVNIPRSKFIRSFGVKDTMDFDYLIPIYLDEVIPGDTHSVNMRAFCRLSTQIKPTMDNMYIDYFWFFVPCRLIWDNWVKMCGEQVDPDDTVDYTVPIMTAGAAFTVGSIFDKMGLPTDVANVPVLNSLPLRAYLKIWNDWFRDENLQDSLVVPVDDGPDIQSDFALQKRGRRHDYFTSCLPWPQKGDAVQMSLGTSADVWGAATTAPTASTNNAAPIFSAFIDRVTTDGTLTAAQAIGIATGSAPVADPVPGTNNQFLIWNAGSLTGVGNAQNTDQHEMVYLNKTLSQVYRATATAPFKADLSTAAAATIDELTEAILVQALLRRDARGGTRYVEILRSHYGVVSPDFRLQRAEFLGSASVKINSHPVPQTSSTSGSNYQAGLASFGTAVAGPDDRVGFSKSFTEHGYVIGLACARADITYQQGVNRLWSKSTRYDFFWPGLQQMGEQAVLNKEIYCEPSVAGQDVATFGYQERYAEYRYKPSEIHGAFRSTYATSLDVYHLAEEFSALPTLSASYIVQNTPVDRIVAVPSENHLLCDYWFDVVSVRPMMTYAIPASLGRF